jgi:hypothetical protein
MSVIYDALNKINRTFTHIHEIQESKVLKNKFLLTAIATIFLGFIGSGIAVFIFFSSIALPARIAKQLSASRPNVPAATPAVAAQPAISLPSIFKPTQERVAELFDLKGIMETDGKRVALINGEILKQGDYIEGARISRITQNNVEILFKGRIFVLRIK